MPSNREATGLHEVLKWNARYPPGNDVIVMMDPARALLTRTRSHAEIPSGHTPVIRVEALSGYVVLRRVRPASASEVAAHAKRF